jgi:flavin-binding protein dodecin
MLFVSVSSGAPETCKPNTVNPKRRNTMSVAKVVEISASSPKGFNEATELGIQRATDTLKDVQGAWVKDMKVVVENGKITEYRVDLKVTFILHQ